MIEEQNKIEELSFENSIDKLKGIVSSIETGQVGLEESLKQYENGMKLISHCREILKQCELKIETLTSTD